MPTHYRQGVLLLLLGEFLLVAMAATIKAIDTDIPHTMLVFCRNAFGLFFLISLMKIQGKTFDDLKTPCLKLHLIRASTGVSAMYGFFYIIRHIPLAEATLVKMSAPFFIPLVAYFWLKDTVSVRTGLSIVIGFIGVVIILRPGTETFNPVVLWGLLAALLASIAKVTIRKMASTEHAVRIVIYFAFFSTLFSLFPALFQWQPVNLTTWGLFALSGLLGTLGQLTITEAYRISPPGKVGLYTYSTIIYASLLGWWFWGEHLNYYTIIGFIFILSAGIINYRKP